MKRIITNIWCAMLFMATLALAISAHAAVTIPSPIDSMLDLEGETPSVTGKDDNFFGNGGGIKNGTLTVTFGSKKWWSMTGKTFTVGTGGKLYVKPSAKDNASCEMNFQGGATLIIDGGTVVNENNRGSAYGQYIGCDKTGKGEIRIVNGGTFTSKNLFVRIGYNGGATGILSIDDGTINVGSKKLLVACTSATGIIAVTNATINSGDIELCEENSNVAQLRFVDSDLNIPRIWANKAPTSGSFCIMDGCTVNSSYKEMLSDLDSIPYQLEGKGLIANPSVDSAMCGTYVSRVTDRGPGPIVKKGPKTVTFKGELDGSADLRVEEGTLAIDSTASLPTADKIAITISGTGAFEGLDQSATYKSLTLGEDAVLPVAFENDEATTFKAAETIVTATADHPVTIAGTGTLTVNTVIAEGLTVTDDSLFVLSGVAGSLKIEDGKLIAVKPDTLTWAKGSAGDNWSGTGNWTYGDPATATTFRIGDSALFATAGDKAVVDADVTAAKVEFTADATVTGTATLATTNITVGADVTATIAAPLSEDIEKTGKGELVLQDYMAGKALDLREGQVTLRWSGAAKEDPFSTAKDANAIAGVLDLGGATQTVWVSQSASPDQTFLDGFTLLNGTLTADCEYWFHVNGGRTLTVGQGATLNLNQRSGADARGGELNIRQGSAIVVDGGTFKANNARSGSAQGNVVGNDWSDDVESNTSKLLVINGGEFNSPNNYLEVGVKQGVTGILAVTNGTVNLANGTKWLSVAPGRGDAAPTGIVSMQGGTLFAETIVLCDATAGNTAQLTFKDSEISTQRIYAQNTPSQDSYLIFDGATWTATGAREDILTDFGCTITIGKGGLTIDTGHDVTISAILSGPGKLVKKGTGKLTLTGAQQFKGGIEFAEGAEQTVALTETTTIAGGIAEENFENFIVPEGMMLFVRSDGSIGVRKEGASVWTGGAATDKWSESDNWDGGTPIGAAIFSGPDKTGHSTYDLTPTAITNLMVESGVWTTEVGSKCFQEVALDLRSGASFALENAKDQTNPFSTAKNAVQIAGTLNLGGGSQTLADQLADNNSSPFRDGGIIENGKFTLGSSDEIQLRNIAFTIGTNANVSSSSIFNMGRNGYLKIDGGSFSTSGSSNLSDAGSYIGNYGNATIEILNGSFSHTKERLYIARAHKEAGNGAIYGINAKINLGNYELIMGDKNKSTSTLMLTNSTLTCKCIQFGLNDSSSPGKQTLEFVGSTLEFGQFAVKKVAGGSSVVFDGASIVDNHGATALLTDLGIPYTIAEGGLTVKVANKKDDNDAVTFPGTFNGEGDFILVAAGKTPREARFSGVAEKGFTGNLVVSDKITVVADGKTFKGGLYACKGSTLNVATSVFEGDVTIEEGVKFAGVTDAMTKGVLVVQTKGEIKLPDSYAKNTYVVNKGNVKMLYYGPKSVDIDVGKAKAGDTFEVPDETKVSWTDTKENGVTTRYIVAEKTESGKELLTVKNGAPANGRDSFESYALNLNAEKATDKPYIKAAEQSDTGIITFNFFHGTDGDPITPRGGIKVKYSVLSASSPTAAESEWTQPEGAESDTGSVTVDLPQPGEGESAVEYFKPKFSFK